VRQIYLLEEHGKCLAKKREKEERKRERKAKKKKKLPNNQKQPKV